MRYITPDLVTESPVVCRTIRLPAFLFHLVSGALYTLTLESSYEEIGDMTPEDVAGVMSNMWDEYLQGGACMIGEVKIWTSYSIPSGFMRCDGTSLLSADYPELYDVIGVNFGGDGVNFSLPDMRGVILRGSTDGGYNAAHYPDAGSIGEFSGEKSRYISSDNLPRHNHSYTRLLGSSSLVTPGPDPLAVMAGDTANNTSFNISNEDPFPINPRCMMVYYIIRVSV